MLWSRCGFVGEPAWQVDGAVCSCGGVDEPVLDPLVAGPAGVAGRTEPDGHLGEGGAIAGGPKCGVVVGLPEGAVHESVVVFVEAGEFVEADQ